MTEEIEPTKEQIIEARTTYRNLKEDLKEIFEEWKKILDMKTNNQVEGLVHAGVMIQLLKESLNKVKKYNSASNDYIELIEKRLEHDVLFTTKL